jgi:hypothetical protein
MGFMDKVRSQATQLAEKAQEGLHTGKEKLDEMQERKRATGLLQELGAAVYREQTGRGTAATSGDKQRLVSELKEIEDTGVSFLPTVDGDAASGGADSGGDTAASAAEPAPSPAADGPGDSRPADS